MGNCGCKDKPTDNYQKSSLCIVKSIKDKNQDGENIQKLNCIDNAQINKCSENYTTESSIQRKKIMSNTMIEVFDQDEINLKVDFETPYVQIKPIKQSTRKQKYILSDFVTYGEIGRGQFGKVLRVKLKEGDDTEYAMKVIKKEHIIECGLVEHTNLEKTIMKKSKNPFLIKLHCSFQTDNKLYLVMELVTGGQFFKVIQSQPGHRLNEEQGRFIAAEILLGLEYIHKELKIIYRDLKPENILMTPDGHIKLTDFGLSKKYENLNSKFFTFAGTPEYLAPEILKQTGHNFCVDFWCFGILLCEMLTGKTPFHDQQNNFKNIEKNIRNGVVNFPNYIDANARDLILQLLKPNPEERLGSRGIDEVKAHPFFSLINWDDAYNLRIPSPLKAFKDTKQQQNRIKKIFETPTSQFKTLNEFQGFSVMDDDVLKE